LENAPKKSGLECQLDMMDLPIGQLENAPKMSGLECQLDMMDLPIGQLENAPKMSGLECQLGMMDLPIGQLENAPKKSGLECQSGRKISSGIRNLSTVLYRAVGECPKEECQSVRNMSSYPLASWLQIANWRKPRRRVD
jgi:hypothetical protein